MVSSQLFSVILYLILPFRFYCNLFYSNSTFPVKDIIFQQGHLQCTVFSLHHTKPFLDYKNSPAIFHIALRNESKKAKKIVLWVPQLSKASFLPICVLHLQQFPLSSTPFPFHSCLLSQFLEKFSTRVICSCCCQTKVPCVMTAQLAAAFWNGSDAML